MIAARLMRSDHGAESEEAFAGTARPPAMIASIAPIATIASHANFRITAPAAYVSGTTLSLKFL
jgi:hypothetical protein